MELNKLIDKRIKEYALDGDNDILEKYGFLFNMIAKDYVEQLSIANVSQQRELLIAFITMREFDIKHENIEESVDYFLKNKESYL